MRSPFVSLPKNLSRREQTERVQPVPEEYEGENQPYRGIQEHGVTPDETPMRTPPHNEGRPVTYEAPVEEPVPVPVRIVGEYGREIRLGQTDAVTLVKGQTRQLLGKDDKRISALIRNLDEAETVYIGFTDNISAYAGGYPLEPDQEISLIVQGAVWVFYPETGTADSIRIGFLTQYSVEL
jgi:hypothetical protein